MRSSVMTCCNSGSSKTSGFIFSARTKRGRYRRGKSARRRHAAAWRRSCSWRESWKAGAKVRRTGLRIGEGANVRREAQRELWFRLARPGGRRPQNHLRKAGASPPPGAWTVPPPPLETASTKSTRRRGRRKALATAFAGAEMHDLDFAHEHAAMTDCFKVFPVSDIARAEGTSV